jgi:hypothetical protein
MIIWGLLFQLVAFFVIFAKLGFETLAWFMLFLQPILASVLLIRAFFIGYAENKYFKIVYWIHWGNLLYNSVQLILCGTTFWESIGFVFGTTRNILLCIINYLTIYYLSKALELLVPQKERKSLIHEKLKTVRFLIVVELIFQYIYENLPAVSSVVLLALGILIGIYVKEIMNIRAVRKLLDDYCYSIVITPKRTQRISNVLLIVEVMLTIFMTVWLVKISDEVREPVQMIDLEQEQADYDMEEVQKVREKLIALGMEAYIANDLLPQDVMRFANVKNLMKTSQVQYFPYAKAHVKATIYMGELLYQEEEISAGKSLENSGNYFDEMLFYIEWLEEPAKAYGVRIALSFGSYMTIPELAGENRFVQITEKDGKTVYYDFNIKNSKKNGENDIVTNQKNATGVFLESATEYRSYSVQRTFSTIIPSTLSINIIFIKEQEIFPFQSLLEINNQYQSYSQVLNVESVLAIPYENRWIDGMFGLPDYDNNDIRFLAFVRRGLADYEHIRSENMEDLYDDYDAKKKYQQALFFEIFND